MFRTLNHTFWWSACLMLCVSPTSPLLAEMPPEAYSPVVVQTRMTDRQNRPVAGVLVRFSIDLQGVALEDDGRSEGIATSLTRSAPTDASGLATISISGLPWTHDSRWFRGQVRFTAAPRDDPKREISPLGADAVSKTLDLPEIEASEPPQLQIFEEPQRIIDGLPVWTDRAGHMDKIVVCLEGFDLYNRVRATDLMQILSPAADALRARGVSIMVVHFPDSHLTPDRLAPRAAEAVQAAAKASGHSVAVVGLSAGGIIARWALVSAEQAGAPLPVNTFVSMDCPNRGARMNAQIQALALRYGTRADKAALSCDAAHVLLDCRPADVCWKWIGLPDMGRAMPVACREDTTDHAAFYDRLHHLNTHNGYPTQCRLIGVSSGSRNGLGSKTDSTLMKLWVPFNIGWSLPASPADTAPGSVLPPYYVSRFTTVYPLGMAGATLRMSPTFIPTASALDADPDETPPFDAWYARPDNSLPIPHDSVDPDEAKFVVKMLLASDWSKNKL